MSITAMKQAIEALEDYDGQTWEQTKEAITSLRQAIAEVEKQPQLQWVGLTLDEQSDCYEKSGGNLSRFAKAIEAKLKEKNT